MELIYWECKTHVKEWLGGGNRFLNLSSLSLISDSREEFSWVKDLVHSLPSTLQTLKLRFSSHNDNLGELLSFLPLGLENVHFTWTYIFSAEEVLNIDWVPRLAHLKSLRFFSAGSLSMAEGFSFPPSMTILELPHLSDFCYRRPSGDDWRQSKDIIQFCPESLTWLSLSEFEVADAPFWRNLHWKVSEEVDDWELSLPLPTPPNCSYLSLPYITQLNNLPSGLKILKAGVDIIPDFEQLPDWIPNVKHIPSTVTELHLPVSYHLAQVIEIGLPTSLTFLRAGSIWGLETTTILPVLESHSHLLPSCLPHRD